MGKRLSGYARDQGVDIDDEKALERFVEEFNRSPDETRDAVLGGSFPAMPSPRDLIPPLPPVTLPPTQELISMAAQSVWVQRVRRLVEYVGEGRRLTDRGNLKLADGRDLIAILGTDDRFDARIGDQVFKTKSTTDLGGVDLTFRLAVEAGILTIEGKKVVPGPNAGVVDDPLETLYGSWLSLIQQIGPTQYHYRSHTFGWDWYAEELDKSIPLLLMEVYRHGTAQIEDLTDQVWRYDRRFRQKVQSPAARVVDQTAMKLQLVRAHIGEVEDLV